MKFTKQPCARDCPDRATEKCRPNCEIWNEYEKAHKEEKEQFRQEHEQHLDYVDFRKSSARKMMKKMGRKSSYDK